MTTAIASPIANAASQRNLEIETARADFSAAVAEANKKFAKVVRAEESTSVVDAARQAGMTRQTLHDILKKA